MTREEKKEYYHQYRLAHREELREYDRKRYLTRREERKEYDKQYANAHKEEKRESGRKYRRTLKGRATAQRKNSTRRANMALIANTLTCEEWFAILEDHEFKCAYCGCSLLDIFNPPTRDHIIPISKGGDNTKENIIPACRKCNSKKGAKLLEVKKE